MSKKVSIGSKPSAMTPDKWVQSRHGEEKSESSEMKRLTFDVSVSLHRRIKSQCATKGVKMADELRSLLEKHFPGETA